MFMIYSLIFSQMNNKKTSVNKISRQAYRLNKEMHYSK